MTEQATQNEIIQYLRAKGFLVLRINSGMRGIIHFCLWWAGDKGKARAKGISDILGLDIDGKFYALEVKKPGEDATPEQMYFLKQVRDRGGVGVVVYSQDEVQRIVEGTWDGY